MIGIVLGTLMTINFLPLQSLIRLYIEVWRGLPILVTVLFIYWLPAFDIGPFRIQMNAYTSAAVGLTLWGSAQVAEATRGAVRSIPKEQHEAAAALGPRVDRPARVRDRPPGAPPAAAADGRAAREHHPEHDDRLRRSASASSSRPANRQFENLTLQTGDGHPFVIFGFILVVFFIISFPLTLLARYLERRLV